MIPMAQRPNYQLEMGRMLLANGGTRSGHPIADAVSQAGSQLLGAYMTKMGYDRDDERRAAANKTLADALAGAKDVKPWVNPDSGELMPGTSPNDYLAQALMGNEDTAGMGMQFAMNSLNQRSQSALDSAKYNRERKDKMDFYELTRNDNREDQEAARKHDFAIKQAPGWQAPRQPVPGVDTPLPEDVQNQKLEIASAAASAKATADVESERQKIELRNEAAKEKLLPKVKSAFGQLARKTETITKSIDRAIKLTDNWTSTGSVGALMSALPNTDARELENILSTIKANIGFDYLQQMRESSPTGGALGSVSENENRLLQAVQGALDPKQRDQLVENLQAIKDNYAALLAEKSAAIRNDFGVEVDLPDFSATESDEDATETDGGATESDGDVPEGIDPRVWKHMTPKERKLWEN